MARMEHIENVRSNQVDGFSAYASGCSDVRRAPASFQKQVDRIPAIADGRPLRRRYVMSSATERMTAFREAAWRLVRQLCRRLAVVNSSRPEQAAGRPKCCKTMTTMVTASWKRSLAAARIGGAITQGTEPQEQREDRHADYCPNYATHASRFGRP